MSSRAACRRSGQGRATGLATVTALALLATLPAQASPAPAEAQGAGAASSPPPATVFCESGAGARRHCAADTSGGVALVRPTGPATCLLGRNWGYDDQGVWVSEGCGGEFVVGQSTRVPPAGTGAPAPPAPTPAPAATEVPPAAEPASAGAGAPAAEGAAKPGLVEKVETAMEDRKPTDRLATWSVYDPGVGYLVARTKLGELAISAYAMARYMNQNDEDQVFTDHLGNVRPVDPRNDLFSHRIMVFLKGWMVDPKLIYTITLWTVNTTDQDAIFANLGYQFSKRFSLYAGLTGNPGSRSLLGSHPYWLGHDRVMADEFFRPYFGSGLYASGEALPGLYYNATLSNNNSALGVKANQLDRRFTSGASVWWMPTTHEFGPRGAYGDWERHDRLATRFGISYTNSPEQSFRDTQSGNPENTTLRLADSVNLFERGALAPGVTVENADYRVLAIDAGIKYRGMFLQVEYYQRTLDGFLADGALPVGSIEDSGFYVQGAFFPVAKVLELYVATSQIFGDSDAGFDDSSDYILGMNWYPFDTRSHRLNVQLMEVNDSPVSSVFGYYTGGQNGFTAASSFSIFF